MANRLIDDSTFIPVDIKLFNDLTEIGEMQHSNNHAYIQAIIKEDTLTINIYDLRNTLAIIKFKKKKVFGPDSLDFVSLYICLKLEFIKVDNDI